ncbi:MAG TPA: glucosamine-6-phosphate deaminase [Saprospiraceae bacterium]|nr:glucosamine-6-phosphate deaminase [Saprospiraceae bacterium]MCB9270266.1 glucosamine-6-phosphate deaminase [Lewinellaceae bacterium]HPG09533.1 glucosamine-6-phosphate deaminase [Saprospiraceae bacterium]HPR00497.1 glucosamine-6-phosphate deaminase [Saprospiraceae bacterium]HRV84440.1 glucosamine-6-phosphate deaminase [Saprospiraceae bacterium]
MALPPRNQRFEKVPTQIFEHSEAASKAIALDIANLIRAKAQEGKHCVLGLATGSTPKTLYNELVRMHQEEGLSFKNVITFNLDEYYPIAPDALQSYVRFMREYLFDHVDIDPKHIHIPDGTLNREEIAEFCATYEEKIHAYGGLDLQILGIGRTGHIGFNEPGSGQESRTRLISLDFMTIIDAASDFFGEENVPRKAITMGVGTIMDAKRIILMAWGEGKANIIHKAVEGPVTDSIPATYLQKHPNATVYVDDGASAKLTRIRTPWLVGECDWSENLIKKAVIWLSLHLDKPILKLTNRDYADNGMGDIITEYESAYNINIKVFNQLQRTITGWPGGKPNADDTHRPERAEPAHKRVIIFSPHPDDDVISMGGTFIRLHDQGHEVHVAYQTSGNIAVFDDDVVRFADFVNDYHEAFGLSPDKTQELLNQIRTQIRTKVPGEIDSAEIRTLKGLIRKGEAKAGCRYVGIPEENMHFQNLPFYETGKVKKKPIGEEDIQLTMDLLESIKPHQVYAAGDLSDPHGTHRVCLQAIFEALKRLKDRPWAKDCWLWLYRGAWQEWDIEDIDMAVPISPEELLRKRRAIFKHQSQKDRPLFPGNDAREFWQRAEERNRGTAAAYDRLGLAEYEAIEAFKRFEY